MSREGGVVSTAVFHMEYKCDIKQLGFQWCVGTVWSQDMQDILRSRKTWIRLVDEKAFAIMVVAVSLIAINRQQGKQADQLQALAQHIGKGNIISPVIIGIQSQNTS